MNRKARVVIVGSGTSGLAAAYTLLKRQDEIEVAVYAGGSLKQRLMTDRTILSFRLLSLKALLQFRRFAKIAKSHASDLVINDQTKMLHLDTEEIAGREMPEMRRPLAARLETPLFSRVYRWHEAGWIFHGGMLKEIHGM